MTPAAIRVLVADDEPVVRDGLAMILAAVDGVEVVGTAADGMQALECARSEKPDVVLMDLSMPGMDGVQATRRIREALPDTQVLVLTASVEDESLFAALDAGARGYLTKGMGPKEIEQAIRTVVTGAMHLDPRVQQRLVTAALDPQSASSTPTGSAPEGLSPREHEVLKLIAAGLSNAEIAAKLAIGEATVKSHINRIFLKTRSRDRAQAVRYAYEHGFS